MRIAIGIVFALLSTGCGGALRGGTLNLFDHPRQVARLHVTVQDDAGDPVAGATVTVIKPLAASNISVTDASGSTEFDVNWSVDDAGWDSVDRVFYLQGTVLVRAPDYESVSQVVGFQAKRPVTLKVWLRRQR